MFAWRITMVMDIFYGDSPRVFEDFTKIKANHHRTRVHPFYVLIWQSVYHLFAPLKTNSSIFLRSFIAVFAGINIGLFSLLFSYISKNTKLNVLTSIMLAVSFPMIYNGSQMVEGFIFTQTSILLCFIYFAYAFLYKRYVLWELLALSLFVIGNNIAYISIFAIFYAILLWQVFSTMRVRFKNALIFTGWFLLLFNIFLFIQHQIYRNQCPIWILPLIKAIMMEEGSYISNYLNFYNYRINFIRSIFVFQIPQVGNIVPLTEWLGLLFLVPFFTLKKIKNKQLFWGIVASCLFFVIFHKFYGSAESHLYSPVYGVAFFSLIIYSITSLPKKIATLVTAGLISFLIFVNLFGAYNTFRISKAVYQKNDLIYYDEGQLAHSSVTQFIKCYSGYKIFVFKALSQQCNVSVNLFPKSLLHDELLTAHKNNDVDIVMIPKKEVEKIQPIFFFGLENRRKLVFEKDSLKDFKTKTVLYKFPNSHVEIHPHDYSVVIKSNGNTTVIKENESGVFINNKVIAGTGRKIIIPDFSKYKYPLIMKTLYNEIMFSIIDGVPYARLYDYKTGKKPFTYYRDDAYVGLFLQAIGRTDLIAKFIENINVMYDYNHLKEGEPDNLGQILYLQSLITNKNSKLIHNIIAEAHHRADSNQCLTGLTDGGNMANYQTNWLIFGLEHLGLHKEAKKWNKNCQSGGYANLMYFIEKPTEKQQHISVREIDTLFVDTSATYTNITNKPFPYIDMDRSHFYMNKGQEYAKPVLTQIIYPISWGDGTRPHIWHAVSLFMYFKDLK